MGLLTQISNKVQYMASQTLNDPDADAYAKEKAKQDAQDAETQSRLDDAKAKAEEDAAKKAKEDADAAKLVDRSKFMPLRAAKTIANDILAGFFYFFVVCVILYAGHLAANDAIGYNAPFRILSFIYGCIFFFIVLPKALYEKCWLNKEFHGYTMLPISRYATKGDLEYFLMGAFCYVDDDYSISARKAVETLYSEAFKKSQIKTE